MTERLSILRIVAARSAGQRLAPEDLRRYRTFLHRNGIDERGRAPRGGRRQAQWMRADPRRRAAAPRLPSL